MCVHACVHIYIERESLMWRKNSLSGKRVICFIIVIITLSLLMYLYISFTGLNEKINSEYILYVQTICREDFGMKTTLSLTSLQTSCPMS